MTDFNLANSDFFPNKVYVEFDMFSALMLDRVGGEVNGRNIVTIDYRGLSNGDMELEKEIPDPTSFSNSISNASVFRLYTGPGYGSLTFGGPGDKVVS